MDQPKTYSTQYIRRILRENKRIAAVGVSLNPIRPSFLVGRWLSLRGYSIIPVNPRYSGQKMWGNTTYSQIRDITQEIDMVQIFRKSEAVFGIVEEAVTYLPNLKTIWMQIGVIHPGAAELAKAHGLNEFKTSVQKWNIKGCLVNLVNMVSIHDRYLHD